MDGYQATGLIRQLAPRLPVIGLTAHALAEERQHCLDAGMVAHVTKPIQIKDLVSAILVSTAAPAASPTPTLTPAPVPMPTPTQATTADLIDWEALSERYMGRQAFIEKLLATVLSTHGEAAQKLRAASAAGDIEAIRFSAHALKGMAGNIEAKALFELAVATENLAKTGDRACEPLSLQLADGTAALIKLLQSRTPGDKQA
jgi:HPt (histidine-containing phosphotransfer) domain-containing protein